MPRIFSSEHAFSYKTYTFGYAVYAERLKNDVLDEIYDQGFLPYSGEPAIGYDNVFYMARSARVHLKNFKLSSENRRVAKKFESIRFSITERPAKECLKDSFMIKFCVSYFEERHGKGVMTEDRLKRILSYSPETMVIEYRNEEGQICACVIEIQGKLVSHYWFSFFDLHFAYSSFGMWLMLDRVQCAQKEHKKYYYLGTVYGDKALYKTNIPSLEYWNGREWVHDVKKLKERARGDDERVTLLADELKNK